MEMIQSLGINSTAAIQFVIFLLTFFFLKNYVFSAYYKAYEQRLERTKGGEEIAHDFAAKTAELHAQYQEEARKVHKEISDIYQKNRSDAAAEAERTVTTARTEAQKLIDQSRAAISAAVSSAANTLKGQTTNVALAITNKLLGK